MIYFENKQHELKFKEYILMLPKECQENKEYRSLLYLLSSNEIITKNINDVFSFEERLIHPYSFAEHGWQTGTTIRTIKLAYNLFNNNRLNGLPEDEPCFDDRGATITDIFNYGNIELYLTAIKIRFE